MKKSIIGLLILIAVLLFGAKRVIAQSDVNGNEVFAEQRITAFDVTANLSEDRRLVFKEVIKYDFADLVKHGIFRYIPESYTRDGMRYKLNYKLLKITRNRQDEPYQQSRDGNSWILKIGDPNKEITGEQVYEIEYETNKAINFFDGHTELYWNVTGNEWPITIETASFRLFSPMGNNMENLGFVCYTGIPGSIEESCELMPSDDSVFAASARALKSREGLSVIFAFPAGVIKQPTRSELFFEALRDNWIILAPILALIIMFYFWWNRGKDPDPETVIPQYEVPSGMAPIVLSGSLGSGAVPQRGITAAIIEMARRGYLHIEYGTEKKLFGDKQTYTFVKKEKPPASKEKWNEILWNGLFKEGARERTTFDDLQKDQFYKDVTKATTAAQKELKTLEIFDANPYNIRILYIVAAFVLAFIVGMIGMNAPIGAASGFATFVIVAVFGWFMPRRTKKGTSLIAEVKGFKWFLSVTEEERLKFHNAPARTPQQFMEFLPVAIALGVEKAWADQFKDLHIEPPEWAEGDVRSFTPILLANSIAQMNTASAASVYSPPSQAGSGGSGFSSGGGFSGGGFGGGGGGSW
jgi:uncharacterized membrane protein